MAFATIVELFHQYGASDYIGESVTQQGHMEQAAWLAQQQHLRPQMVIAALLHDVGHLLRDIHPPMGDLGVLHHEQVGADYLRSLGVSKEVCQLVASHVRAKRYLVTTDYNYRNRLSPASRQTFELYQGGLMTREELEVFRNDSLFEDYLTLRGLDEAAKTRDIEAPSLESYRELFELCLE